MSSKDHPKIKFGSDGTLRLGFGEYGREIEVAAISANGERVLTVFDVGVAEVFDIATKSKLNTITPESPLTGSDAGPGSTPFQVFIEAADFTPDGKRVALGLNDGSCHIYDVDSGELVARIEEPIGLLPAEELRRRAAEEEADRWELVRTIRFSPDGKTLAVGHFESSVSLWDSDGDKVIGYYRPQEQAFTGSTMPRAAMTTALGFSADSRYLYCGTSDRLCFVWDTTTSECVLAATQHTASILAIHKDQNSLRWANSDGTICRLNGENETELLIGFDEHWTAAKFSDDGEHIFVFTSDNRTEICDLQAGEKRTLSKARSFWRDDLSPFEFMNSSKELVYLKSSNEFVCDHAGAKTVCSFDAKFDKFVLSPDRSLIGINSFADSVKLFRFSDGQLLSEFPSGTTTGSAAISSDNRLLVIGELGDGGGLYDRHVSVYDIQSGKRLQKFVADQFQILGLEFGNSPTRFITKSKTISIWDWRDDRAVLVNKIPIDNHSNEFHVFKDGRILVFMFKEVILLNASGELLNRFAFARRLRDAITIKEESGRLYRGRNFQAIEEWNFETGKHITTHVQDFPQPEIVPPSDVAQKLKLGGNYVWMTEFGNFVHMGDGPRGWVTPIRTSVDGCYVTMPGEFQAALIAIPENKVIAKCDFRGNLRASICSGKSMMLINSQGEFFGTEF